MPYGLLCPILSGPLCGRTGRVMLGKFDAADGLVVPDVDTAR